MTQEPEWIDLTMLGASYEEQMDMRAAPDASPEAKYRHRPISFTGLRVERWSPGPAPVNP